MAGPYRCTDMLVKIGGYPGGATATVGVVNGLDIRFSYEGGNVEHFYGSDEGMISLGGKRTTYTLQRWFMTGADTDLLWDLFANKTDFELTGELDDVNSSKIGLSNCKANSWRPILGDANSIVGEELSGEGTGWGGTTI